MLEPNSSSQAASFISKVRSVDKGSDSLTLNLGTIVGIFALKENAQTHFFYSISINILLFDRYLAGWLIV